MEEEPGHLTPRQYVLLDWYRKQSRASVVGALAPLLALVISSDRVTQGVAALVSAAFSALAVKAYRDFQRTVSGMSGQTVSGPAVSNDPDAYDKDLAKVKKMMRFTKKAEVAHVGENLVLRDVDGKYAIVSKSEKARGDKTTTLIDIVHYSKGDKIISQTQNEIDGDLFRGATEVGVVPYKRLANRDTAFLRDFFTRHAGRSETNNKQAWYRALEMAFGLEFNTKRVSSKEKYNGSEDFYDVFALGDCSLDLMGEIYIKGKSVKVDMTNKHRLGLCRTDSRGVSKDGWQHYSFSPALSVEKNIRTLPFATAHLVMQFALHHNAAADTPVVRPPATIVAPALTGP